jgi:hypothetical protein
LRIYFWILIINLKSAIAIQSPISNPQSSIFGFDFRLGVGSAAVVKHPFDRARDEDQHTEHAAAEHQRPVGKTARDSGRRREPDGGRCRESPDGVLAGASNNRAGAEKPDAGNDSLRDVESEYDARDGSIVSRMKTAEPRPTSAIVRSPAGFRRSSRSRPMMAPEATAAARRNRSS